MQNKIIVTVGLKGGGGKSTVCANIAMHLVDKGIPVIVYDADIQQTLVRHRQRELAEHLDAELPYQLLPFSTANADEVKSNMQKLKEVPAVILIDCPGNINDACLPHIYAAADLDEVQTDLVSDNLDTTILFADLFVQISKAKMLFIPNCISEIELRRPEIQDARNKPKDLLEVYEAVTPDIYPLALLDCLPISLQL